MINDDYPPHDSDTPFADWDDHDAWEDWGEEGSPDDPAYNDWDDEYDDDEYDDEDWATAFKEDANVIDPEDALAHVDPDADITNF